MRRLLSVALGFVIATLPLCASAVQAQTIKPAVVVVTGKPDLMIGAYQPEDVGYTAQEYFVSGEAVSYTAVDGATPPDGRWNARQDGKAMYATRVVTMLPADPGRFNGTVVVEWLNVSGGVDSPAVWLMAHRQMTRAGYAYIAVSAQKVGVEGGASIMGADYSLKKINAGRYGALHHPGDAFSYDIFSQIGRLARQDSDTGILRGLAAKRIIAAGESQSATFLATYINAVDPLAKVYDGYLVHSRLGTVARLNGDMELGARESRVTGVKLRPDVRVPTLTFITEGDLVGFPAVIGYQAARQPDNKRLRVWELAGASHADNYTIGVGFVDTGSAPLKTLVAAYAPMSSILGMSVEKPINNGPQHHYVLQAALHGLDRWIRTGAPPPRSPQITMAGRRLVFDEHGLAKGGIRTPWVEVPTARLSSEGNSGNLMAAIFGTSELFDRVKLARLYPGGKAEYLTRFEASLDRTIDQGFILPDDHTEILALANAIFSGI